MLESNCDELHAYYSKELDDKLQQALERERRKWDAELQVTGQDAKDEIMKAKLEREETVQKLNEELESAKRSLRDKDNDLRRASDELLRQKEMYATSLLEKQNELTKIKAEIRETCQTELSRIRETMQKDADCDKSKQKATLGEYRIRLEQAQLRLNALDDAQKSSASSYCSLLRGIVEEVNADCLLLAQAIGVSPKLTNADNVQVGNDNKAVVKTALVSEARNSPIDLH